MTFVADPTTGALNPGTPAAPVPERSGQTVEILPGLIVPVEDEAAVRQFLQEDFERKEVARLYGYLGWALENPELAPIFKQAVAEGWDESCLQAAVQATNWWKNRSASDREWERLKAEDPATAQNRITQKAYELNFEFRRMTGKDLPAGRAAAIAEDAIRNGWGPDIVRFALGSEVQFDPNAQAQPGAIGALQTRLGQMAKQYLVPTDAGTVFEWAQKIARGDIDEDGYEQYLRQVSASQFAGNTVMQNQILAGVSPSQLLAPHRSVIAQTLEVAPETVDLSDSRYRAVISFAGEQGLRPMTLSEAAKWARSQPEWGQTANAKATAATLERQVLNTFGQRV